MGIPGRTRDKAETTANVQDAPDVTAPPPGETPRTDIQDLPRNEAFRHGVEREEATPVRGPSTDASTGRVVTERETVADDQADADATDRNAARLDDPDRV